MKKSLVLCFILIATFILGCAEQKHDVKSYSGPGMSYYQSKQYDKAIAQFDKTLASDPSNYLAWFMKGLALYNKNDYPAAHECFDRVISLKSDFAPAWLYKGRCEDEDDDDSDAMASFRQSVKLDPNYADALFNYGALLFTSGSTKEALSYFDRCIELKPKDNKRLSSLYGIKASALDALGSKDEALKFLDKTIELSPSNYAAWYEKGSILASQGKLMDSMTCFYIANIAYPGILSDSIKKYTPFVKAHIKDLNRKYAGDMTDPQYLYEKGMYLFMIGRTKEATHDLKMALFVSPFLLDDAMVRLMRRRYLSLILPANAVASLRLTQRGIETYRTGDFSKATEDFLLATQIFPKNYGAWLYMGYAHRMTNDNEEAIACFNKAIKIESAFSKAYSDKGFTYILMARYKDAVKWCDKALKINPTFAEAWSNKASALLFLGDNENALKCAQTALKLKPGIKLHSDILKFISGIKK